jgi:hypothetical protein
VLRLGPGRYRVRAALQAKGYRKVHSRRKSLRVH